MKAQSNRSARESAGRALIVDDDALLASAVERMLTRRHYHVDRARTGAEALELLAQGRYDVVLIDIYFEGDWRLVLEASQRSDPPAVSLMMSGRADVMTAVDAMRLGAADFLEKPVLIDDLFERIDRGRSGAASQRPPAARPSSKTPIHAAGTKSGAMFEALALADRVAATPSSSALIVGETGVGKEVLAARIHDRSARRNAPFLCVNLAALAENVIEAELFGSARGAFTDAKRDRAGYLATADGGTILLDEIGEFRMEHQAKLLRVIEERRFFPLGSDRERQVNLRILAATNRSPDEMLRQKLLRPDLFYRLGTVIRIPPLRARPDEIIPLASEFVSNYCHEFGRSLCHLTPAALKVMMEYSWPGNIRELRNVVERAVMLCTGDEITADLIATNPSTISSPPSGEPFHLESSRRQVVDAYEGDHISRVLQLASGSKSRAAEMLGISRSTLYEKLKRYGLL